MKIFRKPIALVALASVVSGCSTGGLRRGEEYLAYNEEAALGVRTAFGLSRSDKTTDVGLVDRSLLTDMTAGIWVDPNGCQHWIIDDGVEGYLSARLDTVTGLPVCSGEGDSTIAYGNFKIGATRVIGDSK